MRLSVTTSLGFLIALDASTPFAKELPLWEAGAGAFDMSLPDYRGSDETRGYVDPRAGLSEILRVISGRR